MIMKTDIRSIIREFCDERGGEFTVVIRGEDNTCLGIETRTNEFEKLVELVDYIRDRCPKEKAGEMLGSIMVEKQGNEKMIVFPDLKV